MEILQLYGPFFLICSLAGLVDSIGGGGGLLTVPTLLSSGLPLHLVLGTNKGVATFGSVAALFRYGKAGYLPKLKLWEWNLLFVLTALASGMGALISTHKSVIENLKVIVPFLQIAILCFLVKRWFFTKVPSQSEEDLKKLRSAKTFSGALAIGAYDGLFGPGTGTFFLTLLEKTGMATVNANALAKVLNFASNVGALAFFAALDKVYWPVSIIGAGFYLVGNYAGAGLVIRQGQRIVRFVVIATTLLLVIKSLVTL